MSMSANPDPETAKYMESMGYKYYPQNELWVHHVSDYNVNMTVSKDAARELYRHEAGAVNTVIEAIKNSRDVVNEDDGTVWCQSCAMILEEPKDRCGCLHLYDYLKKQSGGEGAA